MAWGVRARSVIGGVGEASTPQKAQSWMISTGPTDLIGESAFSRLGSFPFYCAYPKLRRGCRCRIAAST